MRIIILSLFVLFFICGCSPDNSNQSTPERPYSPWISRSVLDGIPRMLTVALHENLWVAYNTGSCGISRAWKGHVNFEGSVYNTAHGPQPVSIGDLYFVDSIPEPWTILRQGTELPTKAQYAGHRVRNGHAELMYMLHSESLDPVEVFEMVEYRSGDAGQVGIERIFIVDGLPDGYQVQLKTQLSSVASVRNIDTNGTLEISSESTRTVGSLNVLDLEVTLLLNSSEETKMLTWLMNRPSIKSMNSAGISEDESLPLGQRLIERNDCKTCHNQTLRTIGPSYNEIAERYPTTDEVVNTLVHKIKTGGAGIWGIQVMSPHPELSETDAAQIVRYILSLDSDEAMADGIDTGVSVKLDPLTEIDKEVLIPGCVTEVFIYDRGLDKIPSFDGRPDMAGIMPGFDNIEGPKFIGLVDNFALRANGYLWIEEAGIYTFRIWSDDGSKLYLNNKLIIDHDGRHSTSYKESNVGLERGYYTFKTEYYQGEGGKFLSVKWKRPDAANFEAIPSGVYLHSSDQRPLTAGLTLPMSVLSRVPGDRFPLTEVHPSYDLFQARPPDFLPKVGGMDFMSDGTLVICTWDATGSVYLIKNHTAENPADISVSRIAMGLAEPLGLKVVDDEIYVLQKQELTQLVDTDGDEVIDEYRAISNDWKTSVNFHEFAFGLEYKDGYFYASLAIGIMPGGTSAQPQIPDRGKVIRISKTDGSVEFIAQGLRTPNGIGWGVDDELFISDNQGGWLPSSKILHVTRGAWYGSRAVDFDGTAGLTEKPPVVWLPQDEIGNSPSNPGLLKDGPYAGQMIHGDVTHGGLKRVFVEKINGEYQGAVFRFIQGLEAGVNRWEYGPDGSIYVGGIGNPGNWQQTGKLWYGLQRLKYNNKPTFEILAVRAKSDGIEIEFTEPLRSGDGWDPSDYELRQWTYVPTEDYGGPKIDEHSLKVKSCHVSADRRNVFLAIDNIKEGYVVYLRLKEHFVSVGGLQLWSTEAWYTMNNIPEGLPGVRTEIVHVANNTLTDEEVRNGWILLFDGKSLDGWRNFNKETIGKSWVVDNGAIKLNSIIQNGKWVASDGDDILTDGEYEDFELSLEWKIANCGNSGIIYNVVESDKYSEPWQTGLEMQVLDNSCHPDAGFRTHKAGDLFDIIECKYETVKPAGEWNNIRLIKKDGHVEHWMKGVKVLEFDMYNDRWSEMVAGSKFKDMPDFGTAKKGKIVLQDHSDPVWYRNIKIRDLGQIQ